VSCAKLISCRVMIEELRPFLPDGMATEVLPIRLHTHPAGLHAALQQAIDGSDGRFDPIFLGYGLCSQAVVGLRARRSRLVIPRAHDCISVFLGSEQARRFETRTEPGTYFLSEGWIGDGTASIFSEFDSMAERYGPERAARIFDRMMRHYRRLAYVRMPHARTLQADRRYAMDKARHFGMQYVELQGTPSILERMINGERDPNIIVITPGQPITLEHFIAGQPELMEANQT